MEFNFEFKYVIKDEATEELLFSKPTYKKVVTVEVEDSSGEDKIHLGFIAKARAREKIISELNEEHGVDKWRFFD